MIVFVINPRYELMYLYQYLMLFFQVMKMLITVVVLFLLCWGPIMTNNLLVSFKIIDNLNMGHLKQLRQAMFVMSYFNSCINPVLYAFMSKNFRNAFKQTFLMICRSKPMGRTRNGSFVRYSFQSRSASFISGKFVDCRDNTRENTIVSSLSVNRIYQSHWPLTIWNCWRLSITNVNVSSYQGVQPSNVSRLQMTNELVLYMYIVLLWQPWNVYI